MNQEIKPHISEVKKEEVKILKDLISKYKLVGVLDLTGLPSMQFQKLRAELKDIMLIRTTKKRLIKIALEELKSKKPGIEELEKSLETSMPALVFSNEDPFKIGKVLNKNKSPAAAKVGQIAPKDLVIEPGPTPFTPGPMIGELSAAGLKPSVEGGKIVIKEASTLAKEGEEINAKAADILTKLGIEPMEIGLNLVSAYADGKTYSRDVLNIDEKEYIKNLGIASGNSFNLAISVGYVVKETVEILLSKANSEAVALHSQLDIKEVEEKPKEESKVEEKPKEEPKVEEKPVEVKPEESKVEEKSEEPKVEEPKQEEVPKEVEKKEEQELGEKSVAVTNKPDFTGNEMKQAQDKLLELTDQKIQNDNKESKKQEVEDVPKLHELAEKKAQESK